MIRDRTITDALSTGVRGRNVLLAGPDPETLRGVPGALLSGVATGADGTVVVSTRDSDGVVHEQFERVLAPGPVRVVDCTPEPAADTGGSGVARAGASTAHWTVGSPTDLTDSEIALSECVDEFDRRGINTAHLVFDSLSTLLASTDSDDVFRYAHALTLRPGIRDGVGLYPVYTGRTDDVDLERLKHLFDGLVEVRERGGIRQVRCRGFEGTPDGWVTLAGVRRRLASSD